MKLDLAALPTISNETVSKIACKRTLFTPTVIALAESMHDRQDRLEHQRRVRDHLNDLIGTLIAASQAAIDEEVARFTDSQVKPAHLQFLNMTANIPQPRQGDTIE